MSNKSTGVLSILDKSLMNNADAFMQILMYRAQATLLPELYEVFGTEQVQKFLDIFAGCVIRVPENNIITECARLSAIYHFVEKSTDTGEALSELAAQYGCTKKEVGKMYLEAQAILEGEEDAQ